MSECGCHVRTDGSDEIGWASSIEFCALHAHAEELKDALRIALDMARKNLTPGVPRREDWDKLIAKSTAQKEGTK